ncbi:MAG TPA: TetR/AcrR family transcriptional regulator [Candidatus Acidoferrum sp.]|nr:TetR/AcrR family transcriptional regulator [Candidatus Acidoferrum sp.]
MDAFWRQGYAGTSLDDLSAATLMNRPSLYNAFGDKQRLYLALLDRYIGSTTAAIREELLAPQPLKEVLTRFYRRMLKMYYSPRGEARGCFLIATAVTESMENKQVRAKLAAVLHGVTRALEERFRAAEASGELPPNADTAALAATASAVLHSLAIQVRARVPRASLLGSIDSAVRLLCAGARGMRKRRRNSKS